MSSRRHEILRATQQASRLAREFPTGNRTSFDVVGAMIALDIPVLFRPLKGLWGAVITVGDNIQGVLVTTSLPLSVQRFTLAHELGHILLGHEVSFDVEIGFAGPPEASTRSVPEVAADTFASELLAQRSLMLAVAERHKWTKNALRDARNVYQLALRLGISYQAACWALAAHNVIPYNLAGSLSNQKVKSLKQEILPSDIETDPWADAWYLTEGDSGTIIEGSLNDTFIVSLNDKASTGFIWQLMDAGENATVIDEKFDPGSAYGADGDHTIAVQFATSGTHRLVFEQLRPWNRQKLAHIDISIDNRGKEEAGLSRRTRELALANAS